MASLSTAKYTLPQHVNVHEFVTVKLSGANFFVWKSMMLTLIESHGLVDFIMGSDAEEEEDWKRIDGVLKGWILATVSETILFNLVRLETARAMWSELYQVFSENLLHGEVESPDLTDVNHYLPLAKAVLHNDWEKVEKFLEEEPNAVRSIITGGSETALMISVRSVRRINLTRKLVAIMSPEDLAFADESGYTALHLAAQTGNIEAAKLLVDKNSRLPYASDRLNLLPLHHAADAAKKQMVLYLMTVTVEDGDFNPYHNESGSRLLLLLISNGFYDIALSSVQRYPESAVVDKLPLNSIALKCSELTSAATLNFWQRMIYSLPQVKLIEDKKLIHHQAQQLLKQLVSEIVKLENTKATALLLDPLMLAATLGVHEVVEYILDMHPTAIYTKNNFGQSVFHVAILKRHEKVYNIIYQIDELQHMFLSLYDLSWNKPLHAAGCLEDDQKIKLRASAAGAALQMQRELQWFKEVEKLTAPQDRLYRNRDGKTASMLFTETHQELVKEAEIWVKGTSNSCTIVAALIVTVVFAAAITVPGGNNSNTGLPFHAEQKSFTVFAISDALALFSSTSSLLMFLSILTSQYSEVDFLYTLPKRLIIGLTTLFLSIIFMMIAFSATVQILFADLKSWVLVPLVALACVPITLFMSLQFSLLVDMIKSTYGSGIFGKQSDRVIF